MRSREFLFTLTQSAHAGIVTKAKITQQTPRDVSAFSCHFYSRILTRYGQQLRRIILLHFGLVTFRFASGSARKPSISKISRFLDVSLSPNTNNLYFSRHQDISNNLGKSIFSKNIIVINLNSLQIQHVENRGKDGHRTIMKSVLEKLKVLKMRSIASWKHR